MGIYFCTGERRLDAGVRFACSSWKRLNVCPLPVLGGELSKEANNKHPPAKPRAWLGQSPSEGLCGGFPRPPVLPEPTHPPGSLSPTLYEQWDRCCRGDLGERGGRLSGVMLFGTRSPLRKVRLLLLAWLNLSQRCYFPVQHRWEAKKPLGRQVGQERLG